jgi:hypothetical protein
MFCAYVVGDKHLVMTLEARTSDSPRFPQARIQLQVHFFISGFPAKPGASRTQMLFSGLVMCHDFNDW